MGETIKIRCQGAFSLPYTELNPFQGELKSLSKENYEKLRNEIAKTGFAFAPHIWKNPKSNMWYLVDGHQRLRTVREMVEHEDYLCPPLPVVPVEADSYEEAKRRVLQGTSQYGQIENQGLYEFIEDVQLNVEELEAFRFPEINLEEFKEEFYSEPESTVNGDPDAVPSTTGERWVKPGDLFNLGAHRLLCGDSTSDDAVKKLMGGEKSDLLLSDPPYGVSYIEKNAAVNGGIVKNNIGKQITNDTGTVEEMGSLWAALFSHADHFTDKASYYVFSPQGGELMMMMMQAIHQSKWQLKHSLIWQKQNFVFGRCDYHYQHEPVLYGWKKKGTHEWYADRSQSSLLQFDKPHRSDLHPTTKPVDILEYLIGNSTKVEDRVTDLFGGSGSTLIACEKTNRKCFMMEIDPHYCQVILDRYAQYSGKDPVREDGTPWSQVKAQTLVTEEKTQEA